jgi:hypothetical protein
MKTSILVSALTLLYSLSTFAGTPPYHNDVNKNSTLVCNNSFINLSLVVEIAIENKATGENKGPTVKAVDPIVEDFHYLKFEVPRFVEDYEMPDKDDCWDTFDYLKFNVPQSSAHNELSPDIMGLPANEFEYLKFNVKIYSDNPDLNSM